MQIMLYSHAQFDPKLAANCKQLSYKIMHKNVISHFKPCKFYWNGENLFFL